MEDDPRRNPSSDTTNEAQVCTPAIKVILQEAPVIGMCLMNIKERRKLKKYIRKSYYHHIKRIAAIFLAAFMWRRPLNSAALATTTHRRLKEVSDGDGTQVGAQMINKCRVKMTQRELYNVRDPL